MAKVKRKKKAIRYYRRLLGFANDEEINRIIDKIRGDVKFETIVPKVKYVIHKALVSKTYNKEYHKKGFPLRVKANPEVSNDNPDIKLGTLAYLFGGSDAAIKRIIYGLIEWDVIKLHSKYKVGVSAKAYKLTPRWENEPVAFRKVMGKKKSVIYKLNERWNERLKVPIVASTQYIYDHYVTLSHDGVRYWQEAYPDVRINQVAESLLGGFFNENKEALQDLLMGFVVKPEDVVFFNFFIRDLYCNPVGKGKRLYHSITNLKREYRKFVLLDGKPIIEVDISCSQPTFTAAFLIRLHRSIFPSHPLPQDLLLMMDLCKQGSFYERVAEEAGIILTEENRGDFKEDFFEQVFYARVSDSIRRIKTAFKNLFPTVYQMTVGIKGENYKKFPQIMQELEAELMVYHVYSTLLEERHIVLVLHDAILCSTEAAAARAKQLIREAFKSWFGQEITFKGEAKL